MSYSTSVLRTQDKRNNVGKIYRQANDFIDAIYKNIDFNNKEVLSVLASSDQMIASYYYGAKNVDVFDRNLRSLYYYYFRRWLVNSSTESYPYFQSKLNIKDYTNMVRKVYPKSVYEAMAKKFWITALTSKFNPDNYFEYSPYYLNNEFQDDYSFIKKVLNKDINYVDIDMFGNIDTNKKYDIVVISNMLEYLEGNKQDLLKVRSNLSELLKDNGQIVCSYVSSDSESPLFIEEKKIMTMSNLVYDGNYEYHDELLDKTYDAGYSYTKKRTK